MKNIKLTKLTLNNFKGIKHFVLDTQGKNVCVYGDNATGKTSIVDAFLWLLFDKDSQNKKDFSIKTLVDGKEEHGLDHSVECELDFDGQALKLRKVFAEKWTKKRGSAQAEFTGHTTSHFINDVPSKKKEFDETIKSIVNEDIFKLLTNPSFFNEQMHWKDRREMLIKICGDIADYEVISSDAKLGALEQILNGHSIDDHRKIIAARRSEINKEIEKIPVRIDEIKRSLPDVSQLNKSLLEKQIESMDILIDEKMTLINNMQNGLEISNKRRELQDIEIDIRNLIYEIEGDTKEKFYAAKARLQEEESNISLIKNKINAKQQLIKNILSENSRLEVENIDLRTKWTDINSQEFTFEQDCNCPTCGQYLPKEKIEEARNKAHSEFNLSKSKKLEQINLSGKQNKEKMENNLSEIAGFQKKIDGYREQISIKDNLVKMIQENLVALEKSISDVSKDKRYIGKLNEKSVIEQEIVQLTKNSNESVLTIKKEIDELKHKRDEIQAELVKFEMVDMSKKRIDELMKQERILATEFEKLEHELYLTEEFIRTKVDMLTDRINSKFKYARFKLFEPQINGGLQECCETTYNGVPYSTGLNNAARINVGLDIINTLSDHYGLYAPIFIDNAESVTKLINTSSQTISLIVSEQDKKLRVEI